MLRPSDQPTILVADDEPLMLALTCLFLKQHGYRVLCANDGHEACELFFDNSEVIDLIVIDLLMPNLSGLDCLRQIFSSGYYPQAMFTTGYCCETITDDPILRDVPILPKPYRPIDLLEMIRELLAFSHA